MIGGTYTVSVGSSLATLIQIKDFSLFLGLNSDMGTQIDTWRTDRNRTLNFILFGSIVISLFVFVVLLLISEKNIIRARIMEELEQKVRERTGELKSALQEIEKMALQDPLTGILNRRGMFKILDREYARIERYGGNLTLVMCDIDHFKRINDVLGHGEGDRALCYTVKSLQDNLRKTDTISRWGGEEFLIALSDIDHEQAMAAAEKLRRSFEIHPWKEDMMVTVSLGVASLKKGDTIEELIRRADQAMYRAKETRNAVRG